MRFIIVRVDRDRLLVGPMDQLDFINAIAKARARAKRDGFYCLPMAYERETIVRVEES